MNKVLVTGGLGILGSFVSRALVAASRQPIIFDMQSDVDLIKDIAADCIIERGDICDLPRLMGVIAEQKPVAIVHLAGAVPPQVERFPWAAINTNLLGTTTVFEAARLSGIRRVVFASSRSVYGRVAETHRHPAYAPVPENYPREANKLYGKLKRACEDVADHYAKLYGLDIIGLRFASSFAPGKSGRYAGATSPVISMIDAAIANRPFNIPCGAEQSDELCYAGDSAHGFLCALDSESKPGEFRAYNIGSGELISLQEMIAVLQDLHPSWRAEAGPGLDYRRSDADYFRMALQKAENEIGFKPLFNFRRAVMDYAERVREVS